MVTVKMKKKRAMDFVIGEKYELSCSPQFSVWDSYTVLPLQSRQQFSASYPFCAGHVGLYYCLLGSVGRISVDHTVLG